MNDVSIMEKNIFFGISLRLLRHTHHPSLSHFYPPLTARCHLFFFPRLYCLLLSSIRAAMYSTIHPTHLIPLNNINDSSLHLNKIPVSLITTASEASCLLWIPANTWVSSMPAHNAEGYDGKNTSTMKRERDTMHVRTACRNHTKMQKKKKMMSVFSNVFS